MEDSPEYPRAASVDMLKIFIGVIRVIQFCDDFLIEGSIQVVVSGLDKQSNGVYA